MTVGAVTIGQSPRDDVLADIRDILGPETAIIERGALDGLGIEEILGLRPGPSDHTLVTRMSDGTEVKVAKAKILPRIQNCIDDLEEAGAELLVLLCTGDLPAVESRQILLRPNRILRNLVRGLLEEGLLGVIVPAPEQVPAAADKWSQTGLEIFADAVSPYSSTEDEIVEKANQINRKHPDLIILDCIGFDGKTKAVFRQVTEKPVLLPRTVLGRVMKEMVEQAN